MNPARHRPVSSSVIAFKIRSLPRCVIPFCFTCSYSERCVRRRAFRNENELTFVVSVAKNFFRNERPQHAVGSVIRRSVQKKSSTGYRGKTSQKSFSFTAREAIPQVFHRCQPAIQ